MDRKPRRRITFIALTLSALVAAAWIGSGWTYVGYEQRVGSVWLALWLRGGSLQVDEWGPEDVMVLAGKSGLKAVKPQRGGLFGWLPYVEPMEPGFRIRIPLWIPLASVLVGTVAYIRASHVGGRCCPCGYDLTGACSPTCPECGKPAA